MAGRRARPPRGVDRVVSVEVEDTQTDRALTRIREAIDRLDRAQKYDVLEFDLVVGTNKIPHGLGRPAVGYSLTPTVADATFAHALDRDNPRPDLTIWVEVVGVAQPKAVLFVF